MHAHDQPARSIDSTPDGGKQGQGAEISFLDEIHKSFDQDLLGGGMAAYGDVIGAGKNIHNDNSIERDPRGDVTALNFGDNNSLMREIQERSKMGHAGLYALMQGQGDGIKRMAGDVAEEKLLQMV